MEFHRDLKLEVGTLQQTVEVTEVEQLIETTKIEASAVVTQEQITSFDVEGRSALKLIGQVFNILGRDNLGAVGVSTYVTNALSDSFGRILRRNRGNRRNSRCDSSVGTPVPLPGYAAKRPVRVEVTL